MVKPNPGGYFHAASAILRAFMLAIDAARPKALAFVGEWLSTVRGALVWRGRAGPSETGEYVLAPDTKVEELAIVLMNWEEVLGTGPTSVAGIIKTANTQKLGDYVYGDFRDALLAVAGIGGALSANRLGKWLVLNKERIVEGRRISRDEDVDKVAHWRLELKKRG